MSSLLTNTKILTRIFAVLILLSLSTVGVGIMARYIIDVSDKVTDDMVSLSSRAMQGLRVSGILQTVIADSRAIYSAKDADELKRYSAIAVQNFDKLSNETLTWEKQVPADRRQAFAELRAQIDAFIATRRQVIDIAQKDGGAAAQAFATSPENAKARDNLIERIATSVNNNEKQLNELNKSVTELYVDQRWMLIVVVVGAIAVSLLIAGFIAIGTITRPIRRMTDTMGVLAKGTRRPPSKAAAARMKSAIWHAPCRSSRTT